MTNADNRSELTLLKCESGYERIRGFANFHQLSD